jgi:hypothetical protein
LSHSSTSKSGGLLLRLLGLIVSRYISNIEMPGGTIRYVPLHPPKDGATRTSPASKWTIDFDELEKTINSKTKMIVSVLSILLVVDY